MGKYKNYIYFGISIVIGLILGLVVVNFTKERKNYYAVFLNNGAVYFGKLSVFPRLKLENAFFVQFDQSGQASLQSFKNAFWGPEGAIYLNKDAVLFIAPLSKQSQLINLIERGTVPSPSPQVQQPSTQLQSRNQQPQNQQPQNQQPVDQ